MRYPKEDEKEDDVPVGIFRQTPNQIVTHLGGTGAGMRFVHDDQLWALAGEHIASARLP